MSVAADVLGEVVVGGVVEGQAGWQGQVWHHLPQIFCNFSEMSPLPLPSGVAYGGEVADELEMVEEEVGSVAQPLSMIVICL